MPLLLGRALRAFADGYVAVLLPAYLLALGFGTWEVGLLSQRDAARFGAGHPGGRRLGPSFPQPAPAARGSVPDGRHRARVCGLARRSGRCSLIAFVGTLNPSSGDVSVFLPLEHARLAEAAHGDARTALFARYSLLGALFAALGALAAALPDRLVALAGVTKLDALRAMFVALRAGRRRGLAALPAVARAAMRSSRCHPPRSVTSRRIVSKLAALFSLDSFAGGLVVNSLLALWLFQRFDLSLAAAGAFFFWAGLLTAFSQLAAPQVAKRIGLLNTMVFTHIPASLCLIAAAFSYQP